jgi:hypothetical protein
MKSGQHNQDGGRYFHVVAHLLTARSQLSPELPALAAALVSAHRKSHFAKNAAAQTEQERDHSANLLLYAGNDPIVQQINQLPFWVEDRLVCLCRTRSWKASRE